MVEKRYWLFIYDKHYPLGGMKDLFGDYDTEEEAHSEARKNLQYEQNYHVYDSLTGEIDD